MMKMATMGDSEYQAICSFILYFGLILDKNHENELKAKELCLKAASADNLVAIGLKHFVGWEVEKNNEEQALNHFHNHYMGDLDVERKDTPYALNMMGYIHKHKKEYEVAIQYYEMAIQFGSVMATNNLAFMYEDGDGVEKNYKKAVELYSSILEVNHFAMNNLAYMHKIGRGVEKNLEIAKTMFVLSCERGNPDAMFNLGCIYFDEKNYDLAAHYFYLGHEKQDESSTSRLKEIISKQDILWRKEYHGLWPKSTLLQEQVTSVLLLSKHRKLSRFNHVKNSFTKHVSLHLLSFLCSYNKEK